MNCIVLRGALRIMGVGNLPAVGEEVDIPDPLVPQLVEQGIVAIAESPTVVELDDDADEED